MLRLGGLPVWLADLYLAAVNGRFPCDFFIFQVHTDCAPPSYLNSQTDYNSQIWTINGIDPHHYNIIYYCFLCPCVNFWRRIFCFSHQSKKLHYKWNEERITSQKGEIPGRSSNGQKCLLVCVIVCSLTRKNFFCFVFLVRCLVLWRKGSFIVESNEMSKRRCI